MRALLVIVVGLLTTAAQAQNPDRDALFKETSEKPGSRVVQELNLTRVEAPSERALYFFTQPGHFAHPSVVIRKVEEKDCQVGAITRGFTNGDKAVLDR